ncbi:unnamed protein product, partial [Staurois parvus]
FSTKSGNPELHSGIPCGAAPACVLHFTLPCAPTMCVPLQCPRPSPPADAGIRLLSPVPVTSGRTGAAGGGKFKKFKNFKKCHFFFFFHFTHALSGALPAFCLFFL